MCNILSGSWRASQKGGKSFIQSEKSEHGKKLWYLDSINLLKVSTSQDAQTEKIDKENSWKRKKIFGKYTYLLTRTLHIANGNGRKESSQH